MEIARMTCVWLPVFGVYGREGAWLISGTWLQGWFPDMPSRKLIDLVLYDRPGEDRLAMQSVFGDDAYADGHRFQALLGLGSWLRENGSSARVVHLEIQYDDGKE